MGRMLRNALSLSLALACAITVGGCGAKKESETADTSTTQVAVSDISTSVYEGTLLTAYDQKVVITGEEGDVEFVTNEKTKYKTGVEGEMYLDDIVSVSYTEDSGVKYAVEIDLVEHMDTAIEFAGILIDSGKDHLTLVDNNLSVTFQIDEDSYIVGDLSQGDKIELTYLGDINEHPYANVVAVVEEVELPKTATIHGFVSEISGNTVLIGIDSAHGYRFKLTDSTKFSGVANHLTIGDQVDVTYEGKIESQPNALSINITKAAQKRAYIINGKIDSVAKSSVTIDTGKAKYTFATSKQTRFNGETPAKGLETEITYTGDLNKKPEATIVYCAKSAAEASKAEKAAAKEAAKKDTKKDTKTDTKADSKKDTKTDTKPHVPNEPKDDGEASKDQGAQQQGFTPDTKTDTDEQQSAATDPQPSDDQGEESFTPDTKTDVEPEVEPDTEGETTDPEAGEQEGTTPEGTDGEGTDTEGTTPETTDPEAGEQEGTTPEGTDGEGTDTEGTTSETTDGETTDGETTETEGEDAEVNPDMGVCGQGTIVAGDEEKKTIDIELKDGTKITLTYNDETKIASGYIMEKGDVVKIKYTNASKILKDIQLVKRADGTTADDTAATDAAATETNAG